MTTKNYQSQLDTKLQHLQTALLPHYSGKVELFDSPASHYRMRAEFRIWHEGDETFHIMFDPDTKQKYRVDSFPAGSELINLAMQEVMALVQKQPALREKLYQIDYLTTLSNQLLISFIYRKPIEENWISHANALKQHLCQFAYTNIIGRSRKQKIVLNQDYVTEQLTINEQTYSFKQIENSFTQPNAQVNQKMITWAIEKAKNLPGDLLELYCGAGNFSVPLSRHFNNVLGTEISKSSVNAAQINIADNQIYNLKIAKLSSEEFSDAYLNKRQFRRLADIPLDDYQFSTVLVDPPRSGLDPLTETLVSQFDNIIYISCNPSTLIENLQSLCKTHDVKSAALFDQFPFTPHIECGVMLEKKRVG